MLEQVKILTSRRAYEFGADAIRLSTLSIQPIQQQIQQLFGFQSSTIGSPIPTFGAVPATYPPGIVFNLGVAGTHVVHEFSPSIGTEIMFNFATRSSGPTPNPAAAAHLRMHSIRAVLPPPLNSLEFWSVQTSTLAIGDIDSVSVTVDDQSMGLRLAKIASRCGSRNACNAGVSCSGSIETNTGCMVPESMPLSGSRATAVKTVRVLGQTSGQAVKPKKSTLQCPRSRSGARTSPSAVISRGTCTGARGSTAI